MRLAFGNFQLDLDGCELTRNRGPVGLERRPTELLCLLASRPGELVGRRELADRIWGAAADVDADMGINTAIRKIRRALGDPAANPTILQTVQGRGYRFIAAISPIVAPLAAPAAAITIAVLPFANLTGTDAHDYLADGFTEELIARLGTIAPDAIHVIGRRSVMQFRLSDANAGEIGRRLGADCLLDGAIRLDATALRVTAALVDAASGRQLWSEQVDGTLDRKLACQHALGQTIASRLRSAYAPHASGRPTARQTGQEVAYDLYLRGRHCWNANQSGMNTEAIGYLQRAAAADPDYALAWSGLADAFSASPINSDVPAATIWQRARTAAANAERSGADLAEAVTSVGFVRFWLDWRWPDALADFRRAADIDPNYAFAHRMVGIASSHLGLHDQARPAIRRAVELDPLFAMHHALSAVVALHAGDPAQAASFARDAIEVDPRFWIGHFQLAQALEQCGEPHAALAALATAAPLCGNSTKPAMLAAYIHARLGDTGAAHAQLAAFADLARRRYVPPYATALIHAALGDTEASRAALEQGLAVRDVNLAFLTVDPKWHDLRGQPDVAAIIGRCGFTGTAATPANPADAGRALQTIFSDAPWSRPAPAT